MNSLYYRKTSRFLPLGLVILMIAGLIFAPSAQAIRYLSDGGGGGGEGDPLDANDYSSGGGLIDDNVQDNHGGLPPGIGGGIIVQRPASDGRVYIIVDFQGRIPVLRVIKVADTVVLLEEPNAR